MALTESVILIDQLRQSSIALREEILTNYLRHELSKMLRVKEISLDKDLVILDLDSLQLMSLVNRVSINLKIKIEPSKLIEVFSQLKISSLAKIIAKKIPDKEIKTTL